MSAAKGSAASASAGRVALVRRPRRRASSSPSLQSAVLPIPGPPATTSALGPSSAVEKGADLGELAVATEQLGHRASL